MPHFSKVHYNDHIARLVAACNWLGIDRGRAARYGELIREFIQEDVRSEQHILAYGESCEIVDLFDLWEHSLVDFPGLNEKIQTVFKKGPLLREEENPLVSSNRARNDAFGYLVAGKLLAAGVSVLAVDGVMAKNKTGKSEADVTFQWNEGLIDIECKRPQSYASLVERTKEGRKQIQHSSHGGHHGVIALDCSVVIRPAGTLLESGSLEEAERLMSIKLQKAIVSRVVSCLTNSICGFLLFARIPAMTRVRCSPIVTALGKPIYDFRPDSISTWLACANTQYSGPDVLRHLTDKLSESKLKGYE